MDNEDFQRVNKEIEAEGEEPYANARNLTSGTLRRLDPKIVAKRRLRFLAHGLGQVEPLPAESYWEWTLLLKGWGLPLPQEVQRAENIDEAIARIQAFEKIRKSLSASSSARRASLRGGSWRTSTRPSSSRRRLTACAGKWARAAT
jgi:DNA ligase (NAD+)